jgi:hypothetical protein
MSFAGARTTIPLAKRPTDYFFIGFFAVACVIALVFDYINAVGGSASRARRARRGSSA